MQHSWGLVDAGPCTCHVAAPQILCRSRRLSRSSSRRCLIQPLRHVQAAALPTTTLHTAATAALPALGHAIAAAAAAAAAAVGGAPMAAVPPICFTKACAADADRAFLLAVAVPMIAAVAAAAWVARQPPQALIDSGEVFEDRETGTLFQAAPGETEPERDANGLLAFRAISYTPWPVPADYEGTRLRLDVGPINARAPRTFVFAPILPQPSELVTVTLPCRPLGIVFEYNRRKRQARVTGVVDGSVAAQQRANARLNPSLLASSVQDGDVLRAITATTFVYPTRALFGAIPPERHVVVYGADSQAWTNIRGALRRGEARDGSVVLVLERRRQT